MKIGETILKLREEKKMSQEEFAQYYHVTILCLRITSLWYKKSIKK